MINPFIKFTGFRDNQEIFISVDKILIYNKHLQENYTEVEIDRLTIDVIETPEEIAAMIKKYYDDQMRMEFIKDALIGISSQIDNRIDHHVIGFVCSNAKSIGNAMMEVLKND